MPSLWSAINPFAPRAVESHATSLVALSADTTLGSTHFGRTLLVVAPPLGALGIQLVVPSTADDGTWFHVVIHTGRARLTLSGSGEDTLFEACTAAYVRRQSGAWVWSALLSVGGDVATARAVSGSTDQTLPTGAEGPK
jgi:hypothetical protein